MQLDFTNITPEEPAAPVDHGLPRDEGALTLVQDQAGVATVGRIHQGDV